MNGKRARAFRAYQKVKTLKPNRSIFDLSHEYLTTGDMGKIYPTCAMEMSPGDTFHIWQESVTRMQPLNAPILHSINQYTHWFFCPYRILWEEWTEFITGAIDGESGGHTRTDFEETSGGEKVIDFPSEVSPELPRWTPTKNGVGSLWDYLGLPTGVIPAGALPLDFLRRCYNRVWNEYYRDETLQEEVSEDNEDILYRNWKKDYFTSALLSQQRGISPAMPVTGSASVTTGSTQIALTQRQVTQLGEITFSVDFSDSIPDGHKDNFKIVTNPRITFYQGSNTTTVSTTCIAIYTNNNRYYFDFQSLDPISVPTNGWTNITWTQPVIFWEGMPTVDFESAGAGFDVKDLRQAFQIQKWLELANRGGVRYTEFLRAFFGVSPRDDRLQRPEYIGGTKQPIVVSEVLQTSSTDGEPTSLGYMAGHGVSASRSYIGSYTATEYGIIMAFTSVMPETKYCQGINRQWLRNSKYDFLFPQFTGLSEQAIQEAEIYATNDEANNKKVFGFNEVYDELRAMTSKITGKMRTIFNYWHLARIFDSAPALNEDFIKCNPSKRIFAVNNEDGLIISIANIIRAVRPLPKYGTPKGV